MYLLVFALVYSLALAFSVIKDEELQLYQKFSAEFEALWTDYKDDYGKYIVPYYVHPNLMRVRDAASSLKRVVDEISERTCVCFVRRTVNLHDNFVLFNAGRNCTSVFGKKGGKQKVTVGGRCTSSPFLIAKTLMLTLGVKGSPRHEDTFAEYYEVEPAYEDNQLQLRSKPNSHVLPTVDIEAIQQTYHCSPEKVPIKRVRQMNNIYKCGIPEIYPTLILTHRIIGGKRVLRGSYPWQVSIHIRETDEHFCGGVLINHLWVLSAAHCFLRSVDPKYYVGYLGKHRLTDRRDGKKVEFLLILYHQNYNVATKLNDIGLAKMKKKVEFSSRILPVCLPTGRDVHSGEELIVTGWGGTGDAPRSEELKQIKVPLIDFNQCKEWYPQLNKGMLCAGHISGGQDACFGDSGGPLVSWGSEGPFEVVGIVSWGKGCGKPEKPGVYTN